MPPIRSLPKRLVLAAAMLSLTGAQTAAAQSDCITESEVTAMAAFTMPSLLKGAMATCKASLKPTGYFATEGQSLVAKFEARKAANWPAAKTAFLKFGAKDPGMAKTLTGMPDGALQPFVEGLLQQMVGEKLKPDQCAALERGAWLLSPLPAENTAGLVGFIVALAAGKDKPGKSGPAICPVKF